MSPVFRTTLNKESPLVLELLPGEIYEAKRAYPANTLHGLNIHWGDFYLQKHGPGLIENGKRILENFPGFPHDLIDSFTAAVFDGKKARLTFKTNFGQPEEGSNSIPRTYSDFELIIED